MTVEDISLTGFCTKQIASLYKNIPYPDFSLMLPTPISECQPTWLLSALV